MSRFDRPEASDSATLTDEDRRLAARGLVTAPHPGLRARLMRTLAGVDRFAPFFGELSRLLGLPAEAVRRVLVAIDQPEDWRPAAPGITCVDIGRRGGTGAPGAALLRLRPGTVFPRHHHLGDEVAFVLEGSGHDCGRTLGPGERVAHAAGTEHDFVAGGERDLVLVVVHGGLRFV